MKNPVNIHIEGLTAAIKQTKQMLPAIKKEVDAEIGFAATEITNLAKERVRQLAFDTGELARHITASKVKDLEWEVHSGKEYSPYIEFGTGALVDVPKGLETYALQFKGRGIRQVNLPARPFFFIHVPVVMPELLKNIQNILDNP